MGIVGKRLFIAVDIDEPTRRQVDGISCTVRALIEQGIQASWVRSDRMHLTLQFFGNADAALEERVRNALARPLSEAAFDVTFDGLGLFPERGSARVLWLGVSAGLAPLRCLQDTVAARAPLPAASRHIRRTFSPHLTLARFRSPVPRQKIPKLAGIPAFAGPSRIDRVTLYESRLSPAGPTYIPLAAALLRP